MMYWIMILLLGVPGLRADLPPRYELKIARTVMLGPDLVVCSGNAFDTNQVILRTPSGLILVDSGISPKYGEMLRQKTTELFPGEGIRCLINTHYHWDHSQGNQVFADTMIIGHPRISEAMKRQARRRPAYSDASRPVRRKEVPPPPPSHVLIHGEAGFHCTPPRRFVEGGQSTLTLGGVTVHLIACSGAHSDNDLVIWLPERGVAVTGDLFFKKSLPILSSKGDYPVKDILGILDMLLAFEGKEIVAIPGHGEWMTRHDLRLYREYIGELWTGITGKVKDGAGEEEILESFSLKRKFPDLAARDVSSGSGGRLHEGNLRALYRQAKRRQSRDKGKSLRLFPESTPLRGILTGSGHNRFSGKSSGRSG